jgi:hypothetical protein
MVVMAHTPESVSEFVVKVVGVKTPQQYPWASTGCLSLSPAPPSLAPAGSVSGCGD